MQGIFLNEARPTRGKSSEYRNKSVAEPTPTLWNN